MSLNIPISARTLAAGVTVFGPVSSGAGLSSMSLVLDIANIVAPCRFDVELAYDGVNFQTIGTTTIVGPPKNRDGTPAIPANMTWETGLGSTEAGGPIVTNAATKARLTVTNTTAFVTSGGSLTVS